MRVLLVSGAVALAVSAPASLARRPPPVLLSYTLGTPTYSFGHGICVTTLDGKVRVSLTGGHAPDLYVAGVRPATEPKLILSHAGGGDWSPDGKSIVFTRFTGDALSNGTQIVIANPDGTGARVLADGPTQKSGAQWSPQGR